MFLIKPLKILTSSKQQNWPENIPDTTSRMFDSPISVGWLQNYSNIIQTL